MHRLVPLLSALVVVACASDANVPVQRWTGTVDTLPSGHIVVRNDDRPLWHEGAGWRVVEELRIGSVEGGGPEAFGEVEAFVVDGEGRIWVLERITAQLTVFDAAGAHVRTIGRRGGGPGEFMQPVAMHFAPDGHLWVVDVGNHRISVLDTGAAPHRVRAGDRTAGWSAQMVVAAAGDQAAGDRRLLRGR